MIDFWTQTFVFIITETQKKLHAKKPQSKTTSKKKKLDSDEEDEDDEDDFILDDDDDDDLYDGGDAGGDIFNGSGDFKAPSPQKKVTKAVKKDADKTKEVKKTAKKKEADDGDKSKKKVAKRAKVFDDDDDDDEYDGANEDKVLVHSFLIRLSSLTIINP